MWTNKYLGGVSYLAMIQHNIEGTMGAEERQKSAFDMAVVDAKAEQTGCNCDLPDRKISSI